MGLEKRIERIEERTRQLPRHRCRQCQNLPAVQIRYPGDDPAPRTCAACGWEPSLVVHVRYDDDLKASA